MFLKSVGISGTVSGSRWRWTGAFIIRVSIVFEGACTPQTKAPYPEAWDFAICSAFVSYYTSKRNDVVNSAIIDVVDDTEHPTSFTALGGHY